jgi:hypothetical protein
MQKSIEKKAQNCGQIIALGIFEAFFFGVSWEVMP